MPDNPGDVYADSAYRETHFSGVVARKGGVAHVVRTGFWAKDDPGAQARAAQKLKEHNGAIHKVRGRIEKAFGTWKRSYGLRRMRWRGLQKARLQIFLTAIAYNFTRTRNIQASA